MTISADDLAKLVEHAMATMNKLSEEDKAANKAKFTEMMGDEGKKAEIMKEASDNFDTNDKDGDGKLNKEEFMAMSQAAWDQAASKGWKMPADAPTDEWEFTFEAYSRAAGTTDGLTKEQLFGCAGQK